MFLSLENKVQESRFGLQKLVPLKSSIEVCENQSKERLIFLKKKIILFFLSMRQQITFSLIFISVEGGLLVSLIF